MKTLSAILKIVAIALNTIFLTIVLIFIARWGPYTENILTWTATILFLTSPAVSLITIVFTFLKKIKILTNVLKVFTIVLNVSLLIVSSCLLALQLVNFGGTGILWQVFLLMCFLTPVINILAIALPFRREEKIIDTLKSPANIVALILKIIVIAFNIIMLTHMLITIAGEENIDVEDLLLILSFTLTPIVTLITIAFTFLKKVKILTNLLKVVGISSNVFWLIGWYYYFEEVGFSISVVWLFIILWSVINILAIELPFRRKDELIEGRPIVGEKGRVNIVTLILKIVAMALNTIFLTIWLISIAKSEISGPEGFLQWALMILFFTSLPVSLIAIVFTFLKKIKILTNVLKVLAIISNVFVLIYYCGHVVSLSEWYVSQQVLFLFIFPVINILAIALPFRKKTS